ncbi:MAG: alpha/beta fold hydrolase [Nitrospiraceae bacterium]
MSTFVLLHGAWHGGWVWDRVAPLLKAHGHTVIAPDVPGHGMDRMLFDQITLATYSDAVQQAIISCKDPVILVGHGLAGMVIAPVAAAWPARIQCLVYLTAYVPKSGQSLADLSRGDADARADLFVRPSQDGLSRQISVQGVAEVLYGDCDAGTVKWVQPKLRPDPFRPTQEPVAYDEGVYGGLTKFFVECTRDRAISLTRQRHMRKPFSFQAVFTLESDHSPMISHTRELADIFTLCSQISRKRPSDEGARMGG